MIKKKKDTDENKIFWENIKKASDYFRKLTKWKRDTLIKEKTNE